MLNATMASELCKYEAESSIIATGVDETEGIASGTNFVDNVISNGEIKKEPAEFKPFGESGVSNDCLEKNGNEQFYDPNSSEFEVKRGSSVEGHKELKFSPTLFRENITKINHFHNEVIIKNEDEDHSECYYDSLINIKIEDDIDISYDVKPGICESGKSENESYKNSIADLLTETETVPNFSHELSKVFWENITKVDHFDNEVILRTENEDHLEFNDNSSSNNEGSILEKLKTEDDIDIVHKDVKPEICEEKSIGNECYPNSVADISIGKEILSNFSHEPLIDFWGNKNFNGIAGELAKHKVNHFNNGFILKNEDHDYSDCTDDSSSNIAQSKTETVKTEYDIDIVCEDIKSEICEEKSSVNESYPNSSTNILIGTEIGHELSIDSKVCPHQNIEEDGTAMERDNSRNGPTVICKDYSKFNVFECKHPKFNGGPHREEKPLQPMMFSKFFVKKGNSIIHAIHIEKPFKCKFCLESFTMKKSLTVHKKIHRGEKKFPCKICLKKFARRSYLLDHEKVHTGEKPFHCKICQRSFIQKSHLTVHERIHTRERPFQCKNCPKSYNQQKHLMIHERIHTGEKPFQCKFCPKNFAQNSVLVNHERIHTGEKPFQCRFCSKSFAQKSYLGLHHKIHTGGERFQCKICSLLFSQRNYFTRHMRIHTGGKKMQKLSQGVLQ